MGTLGDGLTLNGSGQDGRREEVDGWTDGRMMRDAGRLRKRNSTPEHRDDTVVGSQREWPATTTSVQPLLHAPYTTTPFLNHSDLFY